ncbi:MAG TPA: TonB-dependent receptor plug domain-containing protein [Gemmatimonadaceae bacterium]|jgi:TonB-dependent SusC/RagA subfamily outer membrane receptor|nr:TonB-dependent receptor plug domain-containing protein [Gemmatimonadaceae bacterium]
MRTISQRVSHSTMLGLSLGLAACAGQPINAGLRPAPVAARFATSSAPFTNASHTDTIAGTRIEAPPTEERRYASVEEMLNGRIAGLQVFRQPDGTVALRVRGLGSSFNDAEPLLVVDGMMMSAASSSEMMASLSAMQIKRIDVLKDVAATSIYGSRGSHGVVLITTRRGN